MIDRQVTIFLMGSLAANNLIKTCVTLNSAQLLRELNVPDIRAQRKMQAFKVHLLAAAYTTFGSFEYVQFLHG